MQHILRHSVFQGQLRLRVHHNGILKTFPEKICSERAASRRSSLSPSLTPRSSVVTSYQAVLAGKPKNKLPKTWACNSRIAAMTALKEKLLCHDVPVDIICTPTRR